MDGCKQAAAGFYYSFDFDCGGGGGGGRKSWLDSGECSVGGIGTSTLRVRSRFLYSFIHSFIRALTDPLSLTDVLHI